MKLNLFENPPPLWFGEGDEKFALLLRPCTEADRMHVLDSLSIGLAALQGEVNRLIVGWQNVLDLAGNPIPFEGLVADGRKLTSNLGRFLGVVPLATQFQVLTAIVAFIGLPTASLAEIAATLPRGESVDARPTEKPAGSTPAGASASCS